MNKILTNKDISISERVPRNENTENQLTVQDDREAVFLAVPKQTLTGPET